MVRVAPINLAYNPRTLWFNPGKLEISRGEAVVVDTARGTEFGHAASDVIEVSQEEIKSLKTPLRRVVRIATEEDVQKARELEEKGREALSVFKQMASESHSDMHPVSVEFLLDGDKAVFYFEAEDRVDFRDLVRKLASHFHVRIDMRQIGVRDEARIVGGLGHCGQELCCKRMGGDFNPVSIRMAKEQDLSLNPQKISGLCGRLMCCLRYEYEAYRDFKSRAPKAGAIIDTPQGQAKVIELDVPREVVSLKVADEKPVKVPLADFDEVEEGARPTSVGEEAWERACAQAAMGTGGDPLTFVTSQFTGSDKLAEAGAVRHTSSGKGRKSDGGGEAATSRSRSGRGGRAKAAKGNAGAKRSGAGRTDAGASASASDETRKPRRRRSTKISSGEGAAASTDDARRTQGQGAKASASDAHAEGAGKPRRSRNRSHALEGGSQAPKQAASSRSGASGQHAGDDARATQAPRVRPGQKSSGLARPEDGGASSDAGSGKRSGGKRAGASSKQGKREGASKQRKDAPAGKPVSTRPAASSQTAGGAGASGSAPDAGGVPKEGASHRRSRRRSHKAQGQGKTTEQQTRQQGHNQEGAE